MIEQRPQAWGLDRSRWWLDGLRQRVTWLGQRSLSTVHQWLRRFKLRYRRGRTYVHSPDPAYALKLAYVEAAQQQARTEPQRVVLLYLDELTYYRRPTVAQAYAAQATDAPRVAQGYGTNRRRRVLGALDSVTGRVLMWQRSRIDRHTLLRFYRHLETVYPEAETIFVAQDNWPVHFHPDILLGLGGRKVTLLRLPTYAPWTNPIEKVWLALYRQVLHHHPYADDWVALQAAVERWFQPFQSGSRPLLDTVGLDFYPC